MLSCIVLLDLSVNGKQQRPCQGSITWHGRCRETKDKAVRPFNPNSGRRFLNKVSNK